MLTLLLIFDWLLIVWCSVMKLVRMCGGDMCATRVTRVYLNPLVMNFDLANVPFAILFVMYSHIFIPNRF